MAIGQDVSRGEKAHYKTVETYSNRELKHKLCGFGCENCEVFDMCRIGQEALRRGLL